MPETMKIDEIVVGERDRSDLGDVAGLAKSIERSGLLHPVVVTGSGELVAGDRRIAAVRSLGWTEVPVTVVDLATAADVLQAEADENTQRKGLTPYEAAKARQRRARVLAPKAAGNRSHGETAPGKPRDASSKLDEASTPSSRATRKVAATGTGYSGSTLDKVDRIRDIAERGVVKVVQVVDGRQQHVEQPAPPKVVDVAQRALEDVKVTGAAIDRSSRDVQEALDQYVDADPDVKRARYMRKFSGAMRDLLNVTEFDPADVAGALDADRMSELDGAVTAVGEWLEKVREARPARLRSIGGGKA